MLSLRFAEGVKRQERVNARVRFLEGDFTPAERTEFNKLFVEVGRIWGSGGGRKDMAVR